MRTSLSKILAVFFIVLIFSALGDDDGKNTPVIIGDDVNELVEVEFISLT